MNLEQKLQHYRLNQSEYDLICEKLGREPQGVEWALFSALWSEHCSYKTSRRHLKKFFNQSERVLESFGENAGVIDLGEGERVAFKMESHNHPSYIEPYQGAATGVGGILRDIFTMGARPIALANYLCFGQPKADRMDYLVDGVVRGIGGYGNCVGVPTVTGQTEFNSSYDGNILVNAMAVGLFRPQDKIFTSSTAQPGNYVVYVGAKTGKDGVHGASMASESFDEDSESKKPTVQIGDPFFEKLLIESCLEVMEKDLVVAIQDMGAAGITSSSFEMASKAGVGFNIVLDKVPARDSSITPEEILLSESQERMLLMCNPEQFEELQAVFQKWDLDAEIIGEVVADKKVTLKWHGEEICSIDPDLLVENAPNYDRPYNEWKATNRVGSENDLALEVKDPSQALLKYLSDIRGCSRDWVYEQYDQRVGGATSRDCTDSVAVLRLPDSGRALGMVLGCRPFMMRFDAREGAKDAVIYSALELAAKGFEALAITDCLNFGNPEKPELMSEFVASVEGMSAACEALKTPVISGNVSFYNETQDKNVTSTPSIGMVGLKNELKTIPTSSFGDDEQVYLLELSQLKISGQAAEVEGKAIQGFGNIDEKEAADFVKLVEKLVQQPGVQATKVVGKFGLPYCLAKMTFANTGANILSGEWLKPDDGPLSTSFVENYFQVVISVKTSDSKDFARTWAQQRNSEGKDRLYRIGETGGDQLIIENLVSLKVDEMKKAYHSGWEKNFESLV